MKKRNSLNFVFKFIGLSFVKDCLLFGKKEKFFIMLGCYTWFAIFWIVFVVVYIIYKLNLYYQVFI